MQINSYSYSYNVSSMINRTGAFSLAVNGNKRWFPEIADIPVLQKRIAVRIVFSQNRNIPIYRLYRPPLVTSGYIT